jgi:hypothetical protein
VSGVLLHDVPENWLAADFNHRLGFEVRLLTDARAQAARQNNCLHRLPSCSSQGSAKLYQAFAGLLDKTFNAAQGASGFTGSARFMAISGGLAGNAPALSL